MPEVADAFRRFGSSYEEVHGAAMLPSHRRAIADIIACRTEALGGQQWCCNHCGTLLHVFHSCLMGKFRNGEFERACQGLARDSAIFAPHYDLAMRGACS